MPEKTISREEYDRAKRIVIQYENQRNEEKDKRIRRKNLKLLGTCWKYHNCYSCPEGPEDYFWTYRQIIDTKDITLICLECQIDKYGTPHIRLENHDCYDKFGLYSGWEQITAKEFEDALEKTMTALGLL